MFLSMLVHISGAQSWTKQTGRGVYVGWIEEKVRWRKGKEFDGRDLKCTRTIWATRVTITNSRLYRLRSSGWHIRTPILYNTQHDSII